MTRTKPTPSITVTFSPKSAMLPSTTSRVFAWPISCVPTAPSSLITKSTAKLRLQAMRPETAIVPISDVVGVASIFAGAMPSAMRDHTHMIRLHGRHVQASTSSGVKAALPSGLFESIICWIVALMARKMLPLKASTKPSEEKATSPLEETMQPTTITLTGSSSRLSKAWPKSSTTPTATTGVVAVTTSTKEALACIRAMLDTATDVACAQAMGTKRVVHSWRVGQCIESCQTCAQKNAMSADVRKCVMVRKSGKLNLLVSCTAFTVKRMLARAAMYASTLQMVTTPLLQ
mmetsp:Transcript_47413/g.122510  ORF Transcript_47413/g.122510 Transcript_47413/m.122510 type:complete len:290 (+) Transcript_47413:328-1197(+)